MTNREAIEMLKREMKPWIKWNADAYVQLGLDVQRSLDMAIQALEKQEPKKAIKKQYDTVCPVCSTSLIIVERAYDIDGHEEVYQLKHCRYCGQVIDWGE